MEPTLEDRQRLGRAVRQARRAAGYAKTPAWVEKVGRSDRVLLGLERGEQVGPDTYSAVAEALGWPVSKIYSFLIDDESPSAPPSERDGLLDTYSDDELLEELRYRLTRNADASRPTLSAIPTAARKTAGPTGNPGVRRADLDAEAGDPSGPEEGA